MSALALVLALLVAPAHATILRMGAFTDIDDNATANLRDFFLVVEDGTGGDSTGAPSTVRLHTLVNGGTAANAYTARINPISGASKYYRLAKKLATEVTVCRSINLHLDAMPTSTRRIFEMRENDGGSGTQQGVYLEMNGADAATPDEGKLVMKYGATTLGTSSKQLLQRMCCDATGANCDFRAPCDADADCTGGQCGAGGSKVCDTTTHAGCYWGNVGLCQTTNSSGSITASLWWDGRQEIAATNHSPVGTARGIDDVWVGATSTEAVALDLYLGSFADHTDPTDALYGYAATTVPIGDGQVLDWTEDCTGSQHFACVDDWLSGGAFNNVGGTGDRLNSKSSGGREETFANSTPVSIRDDEVVSAVGVALVGETSSGNGVREFFVRPRVCTSQSECDDEPGQDQLVTVATNTANHLFGLPIFEAMPNPSGSGTTAWSTNAIQRLGLHLETDTDNDTPSRVGAIQYLIYVRKPDAPLPKVGGDHNLGADDGLVCEYSDGDSTNAGAFEGTCPGGDNEGEFCLYDSYCSWEELRDKPINGCGGSDNVCKTCSLRRDDTPNGAGFFCSCTDAACTGTNDFECQTGTCSCSTEGCGGTCSQNLNATCDSNDDCTLGDCDFAATCVESCPGSSCPTRTGWGAYVQGRRGADALIKCGFGSLSSAQLIDDHLTTDKILAGRDLACLSIAGLPGACACTSDVDCGACSITTNQGCDGNEDCPEGESCQTGDCSAGGSANVTLNPMADNYMTQSAATTNRDTETILRAGRSGNNTTNMRALLRFDLSASVPFGATITAATLTFTVNARVGTPSAGKLYRLRRQDWSASQSNWNNYKTCSPTACTWTTPGAGSTTLDYDTANAGTHSAPPASGTFAVSGLTTLVQDALANRSGKLDLLWKLDTESNTTSIDVRSSAHGTQASRPALDLTFETPVGAPRCITGPTIRTACRFAQSDCNCKATGANCTNVCAFCPPDKITFMGAFNDNAWTKFAPRCRGLRSVGMTDAGGICSSTTGCTGTLCLSDSECSGVSSNSVCYGHLAGFATKRSCANSESTTCSASMVECRSTADCGSRPGSTCTTNLPNQPVVEGHCESDADHSTSCTPRPTCADTADTACPVDVKPFDGIHDYASVNGVCRLKCGRCSTATTRPCATNMDCPGSETCNANGGGANLDCGTNGVCNSSVPRVCKGACSCPDDAKDCTTNADCSTTQDVRGIVRTYQGTCVSGHCSCNGPNPCRLDELCPNSFQTFYAGASHTFAADKLVELQAMINALPETDGRPLLYPMTLPIEQTHECFQFPGAGYYANTYYLAGVNAHIRAEFPSTFIDAQKISATIPASQCHTDAVHFDPACSDLIGGLDAQVSNARGTCATTDTAGHPIAQKYCREIDNTWPTSGCSGTHCECTVPSDCSGTRTCELRRCDCSCSTSPDCVNWFGSGNACVKTDGVGASGTCQSGAGSCSTTTAIKCCTSADCPDPETCNGASCRDSCDLVFDTGGQTWACTDGICKNGSDDACPATGDACQPEPE